MASMTNLRALRLRHHVSLMELSTYTSLSRQYLSRAELGEIAPTSRLEAQVSAVLEAYISTQKAELKALENDYLTFKGKLLKKGEHPDEQ